MREETTKDIYAAGALEREYDAACKRVFRNKEIIAPILQMMVPEYKGCTVEEVLRCIDEDTMKDVPVEDIPLMLEGIPAELSSVTEKLILYDVHFKAINPVLSSERICVHLHIDLEMQNEYRPRNPKYPMIKRALYYAVRELSAQLGTLTGTTNYNSLEKVYSIWICNEDIPEELRDTATSYSIRKDDIIGETAEPEEDFDLLNVIMIRRGGKSKEKIFDFLNAVFRAELQKIEKYTTVTGNGELKQEVERMTGLGMSIRRQGIEEGREEGREQGKVFVIENMLRKDVSLSDIVSYTGYTMEDILRIKEQMQLKEKSENDMIRRTPQRRR